MTMVRKFGLFLVAVLVLFQVCALGEEGILGDAMYAENLGDRVNIYQYVETDTGVNLKKTSLPRSMVTDSSETTVVKGTSTSLNGAEEFISRLYRIVLNRNPDEVGLAEWANALVNGEATAAEAVEGFFDSDEYIAKNKSNEQIVTDCYTAMLDRQPDAAGMAAWVNAMDIGMTHQAVLSGFVGSNEFKSLVAPYGIIPGTITLAYARDVSYDRTYFVYRMYTECLGRAPEAAGQESWCQALADSCTGTECATGFFFGDEFKSKHLSNEEYVVALYNTILGREPAEAEIDTWADLLNYTNTREYVFNGFLFSQEFIAQCKKIGSPLGRKIATLDNTVEWQNNIAVLKLCNDEREAYGLDKLHTRQDLWNDVAMVRAEEITTVFSHERPDGTECFTALDDANMPEWTFAGENIAAGFTSANSVVNAWMNSQGHMENILDYNFTDLATGYVHDETGVYEDFWSQMFYAE